MYQKVSTDMNFAQREEEVIKFWRDEDVFKKTVKLREGAPAFTFFDGPPTANGKPHIGHVETRAIKDIIPRYRTMKGYDVLRKAGWDTHGLPVELEVEKMLGLDGKEQIEEYGIEPFIKKCKESVWKYKTEWEQMSERVGYWADMEHPYITYEDNYIESEWWSLKKIYEKECKYYNNKVQRCNCREIHLEQGRCNRCRCGNDAAGDQAVETSFCIRNIQACQLTDNTQYPCDQDTQQDVALYVLDHQEGCDQQTNQCQYHGNAFGLEGACFYRAIKGEQTYQCGTIHYDMCILQTNKGDEQTNTNRYCNLQARRNRIKDCFTHICQGQDNKDNTLNKYCSQSNFPAVTHAKNNSVGKVGIQAHARCKNEWIIRKRSHQTGGNKG